MTRNATARGIQRELAKLRKLVVSLESVADDYERLAFPEDDDEVRAIRQRHLDRLRAAIAAAKRGTP